MKKFGAFLLLLSLAATGCTGSKQSGGDDDDDDDDDGDTLPGAASILHGPSAPTAFAATGEDVGPWLFGGTADGTWDVSPNQGRATLLALNFFGEEPGTSYEAPLTNCEFTWTRDGGSLTELLTCPFEVRVGTYIGMGVGVSTTFEVLIDDSTNGLFTDPSSATLLSAAPPAGGADFVDFVVPGPGGSGDRLDFQTYFTEPLVVGSGEQTSVTVNLVVDMTHTMQIDVIAGAPEFPTDFIPVPMFLFMTPGAVSKAAYYTGLGTAENVLEPGPPNTMRFFYSEPDVPAFVWSGGATAGCQDGTMASNAWNIDAATAPVGPNGPVAGGWLGLDSSGTLCWALPYNTGWSSYGAVFTMPEALVVGSSSQMSCQFGGSIPPPTSGENYSSGCPTINVTGSASLTLVAD